MFWRCGLTVSNGSVALVVQELASPQLIGRIGADHAHIDRLLQALEDLLGSSRERQSLARAARCLSELDDFTERLHHPLEDRIFDQLVNKGLTPWERRLVFRNLHQHQEIRELSIALMSELDHRQTGAIAEPSGVTQALSAYLSLQREHLRFEESHLLPLLMATFNENDWQTLSSILIEDANPLTDQESS
jgi:hemerythrin-like domain-containing protein